MKGGCRSVKSTLKLITFSPLHHFCAPGLTSEYQVSQLPLPSLQIAPYTTCLVNGIFWAPGSPRLITKDQFRSLQPEHFSMSELQREGVPELPQRLLTIADISNDSNVSFCWNRWWIGTSHSVAYGRVGLSSLFKLWPRK